MPAALQERCAAPHAAPERAAPVAQWAHALTGCCLFPPTGCPPPSPPQTLPDGPYLAHLQRLRLACNRLPRVPLALERATRLTFLDLSHNADLSLRPAGLRVLQGLTALRQLQACGYQGPHSELELGGVPWEALRDDLPGVSVASSCDVGCPLRPPLDV